MKPSTFSNAVVAVTGAYAEALAEQALAVEQLSAALRSVGSPDPRFLELLAAVDVVLAIDRPDGKVGELVDALEALRAVRSRIGGPGR